MAPLWRTGGSPENDTDAVKEELDRSIQVNLPAEFHLSCVPEYVHLSLRPKRSTQDAHFLA